jgi:hypothetical protein
MEIVTTCCAADVEKAAGESGPVARPIAGWPRIDGNRKICSHLAEPGLPCHRPVTNTIGDGVLIRRSAFARSARPS